MKRLKKIELRGMAWDHPRGYEPLWAASGEFSKVHQEVSIKWDVRSLKEFGDMPIEELIERYDIITIDHPYVGQADENGLLLQLEKHISENVLATLGKQSVGPSFHSYRYNNHIYALPIDAAALVAASRDDLMGELGLELPLTRKELKRFYGTIPVGFSVAWPLCPTDLWCTFLSLGAQDHGPEFITERRVDKKAGAEVLNEIKFHLEFLHPGSIDLNPIQILDRMGNDEEIIYSPYLFGYTNYSRKGYTRNPVHFSNSPLGENRSVSTILGGVGLAVSSHSNYPASAVNFVEFVAGAEIQEGIFTRNGGQPANLKAWHSRRNNALCDNFFENTLETMENAYLRPRHPGWNKFQEQGAALAHAGVLKNRASEKIMDDLNDLYQTIETDGKL